MKKRYPFLLSIPHGGVEVPKEVRLLLALAPKDLRYYCDPETRTLFSFGECVAAFLDTPVSRMIVDLNRPPYPVPPRDPDGIVKSRTIDGKEIYRQGQFPNITLIHRLLMDHYFPYHARVDHLLETQGVRIAFDCHSMLPHGSSGQKDAGRARPQICLGNNGDRHGNPKKGSLTTCPAAWIQQLAEAFRDEFSSGKEVAINNPFSGGFITNAHYWHKGIPWIQVEVNRALYEPAKPHAVTGGSEETLHIQELRKKIWHAFTTFWDSTS